MSEPVTKDKGESDGGSSADEAKPRIDWADPNVPVGDAPPLAKWPLVLLSITWLAWIALLALMAVSHGAGTAV
jgi:hypothetical protein